MPTDQRLDKVASWVIVTLLAMLVALGTYVFRTTDHRLESMARTLDALRVDFAAMKASQEDLRDLKVRVRGIEEHLMRLPRERTP